MDSLIFEEYAKKAIVGHRRNIERITSSSYGAKKVISYLESTFQSKLPNNIYVKESTFVKYAKTFAKPGKWEELTSLMFDYASAYCLTNSAVKIYSTKDLGNTKLLYKDIKDKVSSTNFIEGESYCIDCICHWENEYCPTRVGVFSSGKDFVVITVTIKQLKKGQTILHEMSLDWESMSVVSMNKKSLPARSLSFYDTEDTPLSNLLHYLCINGMSIVTDYKKEMNKIPEETPLLKHHIKHDGEALFVHQEVRDDINDNTYVDLKEWVANMSYAKKEWQGGHHASPRPHNRVGHFRRCKKGNYLLLDGVFVEVPKGTGNYCKVRACAVNHKTTEEITKERIFTV